MNFKCIAMYHFSLQTAAAPLHVVDHDRAFAHDGVPLLATPGLQGQLGLAGGPVLGQARLGGVQLLRVVPLGPEGSDHVLVGRAEGQAAAGAPAIASLSPVLRIILHCHERVAPQALAEVPAMLVHLRAHMTHTDKILLGRCENML